MVLQAAFLRYKYVPPSQRQPIAEVSEDEGNNELPLHASLPWVPGVSEKLRKEFKKANIKTTFKSTSLSLIHISEPTRPY